MLKIEALLAFEDNYIWCLYDTEHASAWVVDPGDAQVVINFLARHKLKLQGILITHHHWDHTQGVAPLKSIMPNIQVIGSRATQHPSTTHYVQHEDEVELDGIGVRLKVIATPGHTLDHICYYNDQALFCGDTLFSAGCGRIFEGSATQMYHALMQLSELDDETYVYCTHEYTENNLFFAEQVEPENQDIQNYKLDVQLRRSRGLPSLPSQLKIERAINPFLRCHHTSVQESVMRHNGLCMQISEKDVFALLRTWKDNI